ncbi:FtsK/SpoIIIE domain-containing protein [Schaalia odontolytica]|uniref:FtsK/SpoIIIE domain-containing protein n=1 Tax=Schaalia odontolytica TaxID=1660 RepID=UPI001D084EA8|nr:FtsK/SpoIIIE domain-containing protein [Schaalia odontolytica]MCB6402268.1 cell division protein FtsK [Schaalia odontolytica]
MSDSGCLARSALRADLHLACVDGPDVGLVLAPGVVGRTGDVPLSCASVAREHADFSTRGGRARLRTFPGATPVRVRTRLGPWRRLGARACLSAGRRVRLGGDVLEVRPRPRSVAWPVVDRRGRGAFSASSLLRGAPFVSIVVMGVLMAWRLHSLVPGAQALRVGAAIVAFLACACAIAWVRRTRRSRRGWDGAALALVLASLPDAGAPPPSWRAAVWPGRARGLGSRVTLAPHASAQPGDASSLGVVGRHGAECALWCAGQVAAQVGGARVWWDSRSPVLLGAQGVDIHVTDRERCPACTRASADEKAPPVLHIGYARRIADLPSWCARVCVTDEQPVSARWWWTVARPDGQDTLPTRLDWDPRDAQGVAGGLGVVIGRAESGPVSLDLVADGPHALVAGCTGSGKSEALLGWLASIAHCYSPERVRFILIDYKGGSTFARLADLPHTQALLTDLDAGATSRALDGIASLLLRREAALSELALPDLTAWERAHEADPGTVAPPPPRLVVAIDEFRVLADTHPSSMDVLLRLAAQGRSLGLHLIAATQRPSGAVSASMRANMDIRLALRCVSAADSTDILGDARASFLPRVPGRAVLAGTGALQLSYMADVSSVVAGCAQRWPPSSSAPLWAPALPEVIGWEDVDRAGAGVGGEDAGHALRGAHARTTSAQETPGLALGLVEGIDAHTTLLWDGGSIQIQASAHEADVAARWVRSLATRIAGHRRLPLHVIGEERVSGANSCLSPGDLGAIDLLEGVCEHGPAVLAVTDVGALRACLAQALSIPQAEDLWSSLLARARRAGIVIVAAYCGRFTSSTAAMGAFSMRLVRARDADEALHAGLLPSDLRALGEGQALLARPGEPTALACVPLEPAPIGAPPLGVEHRSRLSTTRGQWRIPSPSEAASLVSNSQAPALIGPEYTPARWEHALPWIIVGTEAHACSVEALHAALGWDPPLIDEIIPESAWTRITRWDGHRLLALNPSENVIRALIRASHTYPLSIAAHHWNPSCGLICEGDTLTTIQLTAGSVKT